MYCVHCKGTRPETNDWHSCQQATDHKEQIDKVLANIEATMLRPGNRELSSDQMKNRADSLRQISTGIRLAGGEVKDDYKELERNE